MVEVANGGLPVERRLLLRLVVAVGPLRPCGLCLWPSFLMLALFSCWLRCRADVAGLDLGLVHCPCSW